MRKFLIPLLMASAVIPAAAHAQDRDRDGDRRAERAVERSEGRGEARQERAFERRAPEMRVDRPAPEMRVERPASDQGASQRSDVARERAFGQRGREMRSDRATEVARDPQSRDGGPFNWGDRQRANGQEWVNTRGRPTLPTAEAPRTTTPDPRVETRDGRRGGFEGLRDRVIRDGRQVETHRDDRHHDWNRDWRNNHQYDWRRYRDRNRFVFRIGTYYDPYRYGYRRFSIGYNLWPSYYGSNYWLNDPWMYRLPPAYGPYRWVRYYDDALLVNIYTGQVVDVIYSFFW
ncbi:RcnB family protein [Sphingomonas jaspsi]|uniref:RcnB family protein n=1 Tax=Sphingomonas jaspsi TaxID=392409 RepID=UPI0004B16942|nr:RcnB family protein [Sphingomonas jaspsi]